MHFVHYNMDFVVANDYKSLGSLSLQANEAVCLVEVDGAPVLSPPAGMDMDMYGTEKLGVLGKIRSWKAVSPN
jgi:hypothetical protein